MKKKKEMQEKAARGQIDASEIVDPMDKTPFYYKLKQLNDQINMFKEVFYSNKPKYHYNKQA